MLAALSGVQPVRLMGWPPRIPRGATRGLHHAAWGTRFRKPGALDRAEEVLFLHIVLFHRISFHAVLRRAVLRHPLSILSFEMLSFVIVSFFMSSAAKAVGENAMAKPSVAATT